MSGLLSRRRMAGVRVSTTFEYGQFYAVAVGREVTRLKGGRNGLTFHRPAVASAGPTPEAAIEGVARILRSLRRHAERSEEGNTDG